MADKGARVDWEDLRRRLARAREILERADRSEDAGKRRARILAERARAIAAEPPAPADGAELDVLEFALGSERYAVESAFVEEVHALREFTPVPCVPDFVLGICGVRGRIVSIIDLRPFFGMERQGLGNLNRALLLRGGAMEFAILADAVIGQRRVPLSDLRPPLLTHTGARERYLRAIGKEGLLVLDARKLLGDEAIIVREPVASPIPSPGVNP